MRPFVIKASAAGPTAWYPVDYLQHVINIGLGATVSASASLTYKVQHTFDDPWFQNHNIALSRVTTTATATIANHSANVGDTILINGAGAPFDGTFLIAAITDANNVTYTVANSYNLIGNAGAYSNITRAFDNAVLTGETGAAFSNLTIPVRAVRLNITSYTSGTVRLQVIQGSL